MTTQQWRDHVRQHWETIRAKLLAGTYVPSPVRPLRHPTLRPPCKAPLRSTAGCGNPHVRWCGRVPGRNSPGHPTRSISASLREAFLSPPCHRGL
jgi:hypothetical protein